MIFLRICSNLILTLQINKKKQYKPKKILEYTFNTIPPYSFSYSRPKMFFDISILFTKIRTYDLWVMSPTSYLCSTPQCECKDTTFFICATLYIKKFRINDFTKTGIDVINYKKASYNKSKHHI